MAVISNQIGQNQTLSFKALQSPSLASVLKVGQLLTAQIQPLNSTQAQVTIGQHALIAQTPSPIQEKGTVQLKVTQVQPNVQLNITANNENKTVHIDKILQSAYRQFTPAQAPLNQVFSQMNQLSALPTSLQAPLQQLLQLINKNTLPNNASSLKQKVQDSGLFLESKLNAAQKPSAATIKNDLKANLLQLQNQVSATQTQQNSATVQKLSSLLNQALSRITVQQIQLYENPQITLFEYPNTNNKMIPEDFVEFRQLNSHASQTWEAYIDLQLKLGTLSTKLQLNHEESVNCYIWCENETLQDLVASRLEDLQALFKQSGIDIINLQMAAQKPEKSTHSSKVALIDITI